MVRSRSQIGPPGCQVQSGDGCARPATKLANGGDGRINATSLAHDQIRTTGCRNQSQRRCVRNREAVLARVNGLNHRQWSLATERLMEALRRSVAEDKKLTAPRRGAVARRRASRVKSQANEGWRLLRQPLAFQAARRSGAEFRPEVIVQRS